MESNFLAALDRFRRGEIVIVVDILAKYVERLMSKGAIDGK